jgi:hypothetical protein
VHAPAYRPIEEGSDHVLGRKDYTQREFDHGKVGVERAVAAYGSLMAAIGGGSGDANLIAVRQQFEASFFNSMVVVLDRYFVYRLRVVTGKDANPLNEVEILADSVMNNDGVLRVGNVIKWIPDQTVLKLKVGDTIRLTAADFDRLSAAFFADLKRKFL